MCGIVGYVGDRECSDILLSGLRRLEYRGYDSAGIAIGQEGGDVQILRSQGKLDKLINAYRDEPFDGRIGLGHTRWATHGSPSERNAHPHSAGDVVVAHNGIIENYMELKERLQAAGRTFESDTDTEVIAHLIDEQLQNNRDLHLATRDALAEVEGSYAVIVMERAKPDKVVVARNASPMVLSRKGNEVFAASDIPAVLPYTREFLFLEDGDIGVLEQNSIKVYDKDGNIADRETKQIDWDPASAEKQGYKHFMLKEIHEQPTRIIDTLRGRVRPGHADVELEDIGFDTEAVQRLDKIVFLACGTSHYATLIAKNLVEAFAGISVDAELASEFRYRKPVIDENTLAVAVSQSGETADTLAAIRQADKLGASTLGIINVLESTIAREADERIYTHAGPEIGVASTKAFTAQLAAVAMLAIWLGRQRGELETERSTEMLQALRSMPNRLDDVLELEDDFESFAPEIADVDSALYLGRGLMHPVALEGALKLKEISYIHAEGYAAGEMKHGPIALIDEEMPVIVLAPQNETYDKTLSNLEEVKAREGQIIAIASEDDDKIDHYADTVFRVPEVPAFVEPIVYTVAVQLLAYYVADFKGTDIDQPRNLAKSVTVE